MPVGKPENETMPTGNDAMPTETSDDTPHEKPFTRFVVSFVRSDLRLDMVTDHTLIELCQELLEGVVLAWLAPTPQTGSSADRTKWGRHPYIMTASGVEYLQIIETGTMR